MTTRVTKVSLQADVSQYTRNVRLAGQETDGLRGKAERFSRGRYGATIGADTTTADRDLSALERELARISQTRYDPTVVLEDTEAANRLSDLNARLDALAAKTADAKVHVDDADAQSRISRIEGQLLAIGQQTADPKIDLGGIADAEAKLGSLEAQLTKLDHTEATPVVDVNTDRASRSASLLTDVIVGLGPTAVAATGVAAGAVAGLGVAFGAAAAAGAGLGATIVGQLASMKQQQQQIQKDATHLQTLTKGTAEYTAASQNLRAEMRAYHQQFGAAADAVDRLKLSWTDYLTTVGQHGVNQLIADAAGQASRFLPKLEGIVEEAAGSVDGLLNRLGAFASSTEGRSFLAFMQVHGPAAMTAFGTVAGNVGKGLASLFMAFAPEARLMTSGLEDVSRGFAAWAQHLPDTQGFESFMDYVHRVGPQVWDTLGAVAGALAAVVKAAAPVGPVMLPVIKDLANVLAAVAGSPVGPVLVGAASGLALLNRALTVTAALCVSKIGQEIAGVGSNVGVAGAKAFAAKAGFVAAGVGLEILASHLHKSNEGLSDVATILGGAAIGAAAGPFGAAIGAAGGALQVFAQHSQEAADAQRALDSWGQSVAATLDKETGAVTRQTTALVQHDLAQKGAYQSAQALGLSFDTVTQAALGDATAQQAIVDAYHAHEDALYGLTKQSKVAATSFSDAYQSLDAVTASTGGFSGMVASSNDVARLARAYKLLTSLTGASATNIAHTSKAIVQQNVAIGGAAARMKDLSLEDRHMGGAVSEFGAHIDALTKRQKANTSATQRETLAHQALNTVLSKSRGSLAQLELTIESAAASMKGLDKVSSDGGRHIDVYSHSGATLTQQLVSIATAAGNVTGSQKTQAEAIDRARTAMLKLLDGTNLTDKAARRYADEYLKHVNPTLDATKSKLDQTTASAKDLGDTKPNVKVTTDTQQATADLRHFRDDINSYLNEINDEPVNVTLTARANKVFDQLGSNIGLADGGPVYGPGGPRDDKINARLSNGERVNSAAVVTKAGHGSNRRGQAVFAAFERLVMRGELGRFGDLQPFADGGPVVVARVSGQDAKAATQEVHGWFDAAMAAVNNAISGQLSRRLSHLPTAGQLGPGGVLTPAQVARGQDFAKAQVGKPYVWGGVGPGGYDCSGFQSAILNFAMGMYPYARRGSTWTMPWAGSRPGLGRYTIGWENYDGIGHTAGNIGGLNVESYGGHGPAVGSGARGPLDPLFDRVMHYDSGGALPPGVSTVYNGLRHAETVIPAPPARVNAALTKVAAGGGGVPAAMIAAVNAVQREVARLRNEISGGVPVDVRNAREIATGVRGVAQRTVDAQASWMQP